MVMKTLIAIFFKHKEYLRTRWREVALVNEQCPLDIREYSVSHRIINKWDKLATDYIHVNRVNMFKNKLGRYM